MHLLAEIPQGLLSTHVTRGCKPWLLPAPTTHPCRVLAGLLVEQPCPVAASFLLVGEKRQFTSTAGSSPTWWTVGGATSSSHLEEQVWTSRPPCLALAAADAAFRMGCMACFGSTRREQLFASSSLSLFALTWSPHCFMSLL